MNGIRAFDGSGPTLARPRLALCVIAALVSLCVLPGCERDAVADREQEIQRITTTIKALEKRIERGEYPNLEESMKRQLEARRAELAELQAASD